MKNPMAPKLTNLFLLSCFFILFCCRGEPSNGYSTNDPVCIDSWSLIKNSEKVFMLDSVSDNRPYMIQLFTPEKSNDSFLTCFNSKNYSIDFFDFNSGEFRFRTKLHEEGPDGVSCTGGYTIKNLDSIFLYGEAKGWMFSIVDTSGHRIRSELLELEGQGFITYFPYPTIEEGKSMYFVENNLVCVGNTRLEYSDDTRENRKVLAFYDLNNFVPDFKVSYPEFYQHGNWWGNLFRTTHFTYNPNAKTFVVSFPASHSVTIYDVASDQEFEKYAGGCSMGTIHPGEIEFTQTEKTEPLLHFLRNDHYLKIIYDPYERCYYRFGVKGAVNANLSDRSTFLTKLYIIILDENFNKQGEIELDPKDYGVGGLSFVTKDGLWLNHFADKSEDRMVFHRFNLRK